MAEMGTDPHGRAEKEGETEMISVLHTIFVMMLYALGILVLGFFILVIIAMNVNVWDKGIRTQSKPERDDQDEQI